MLGTKTRQFRALPHLTPDELVPADHFYRHLERVLDMSVTTSPARANFSAHSFVT